MGTIVFKFTLTISAAKSPSRVSRAPTSRLVLLQKITRIRSVSGRVVPRPSLRARASDGKRQASPPHPISTHPGSLVRLVQLAVHAAHRRASHETGDTRLGVRVCLRVIAVFREVPLSELMLLRGLLPDHHRGNEIQRVVRAFLHRRRVANFIGFDREGQGQAVRGENRFCLSCALRFLERLQDRVRAFDLGADWMMN